MATKAKGGFGAKLYREDSPGSNTFSIVAEAKDFSGPARTHQTADVTNMDSPNGWVENIALGIKEAGDLTFDCNLVDSDTSQANLIADLNSGTLRNWRLVYPSGAKRVAFSAYVASLGNSVPVKGAMTLSVTLKISGQVVTETHP